MARRITKLDVTRFTTGDCHILAHEIHRLTDWPMAAFWFGGQPDTHAFVKLPSAKHARRYYLDIHGVQSTAQMYDRWGQFLCTKEIRETSEAAFEKWWMSSGNVWQASGSYTLRRARELAPLLVGMGQTHQKVSV